MKFLSNNCYTKKMQIILFIVCLFTGCNTEKPVTVKKHYRDFKKMRSMFREISVLQTTSYEKELLWKNFLLCFSEDFENTKDDERIRGTVEDKIRKIVRARSIKTKKISKEKNTSLKAKWHTKIFEKYGLSYKVRSNWHSYTQINNQIERAVIYQEQDAFISFDSGFDDLEEVSDSRINFAIDNIYIKYAYSPIQKKKYKIKNLSGYLIKLSLIDKLKKQWYSYLFFAIKNGVFYSIHYIYTKKTDPQLLNDFALSMASLQIKDNYIDVHPKKNSRVIAKKLGFEYEVGGDWRLLHKISDNKQHIAAYLINNFQTIIFMFRKNRNNKKVKKTVLDNLGVYDLINTRKYKVGPLVGVYSKYNIKPAGERAELYMFSGVYQQKSCLIYYIHPETKSLFFDKAEKALNSIKPHTKQVKKFIFKPRKEISRNLPIEYKISRGLVLVNHRESMVGYQKKYKYLNEIVVSVEILRSDLSLKNRIEQYQKILPLKLEKNKKHNTKMLSGEIYKGSYKDLIENSEYRIRYFFAKKDDVIVTIGYWCKKNKMKNYKTIFHTICNSFKIFSKLPRLIRFYTKKIEQNPLSETAYFYRGKVYERKERYKKALKDYNKALQIAPGFLNALYAKGTIFQRQKKHIRAANIYRKLMLMNFNLPLEVQNYAKQHSK